jgi:hypothetical protein
MVDYFSNLLVIKGVLLSRILKIKRLTGCGVGEIRTLYTCKVIRDYKM